MSLQDIIRQQNAAETKEAERHNPGHFPFSRVPD